MSVHNPELQLANDFVFYTNRNVFLTGKAGTGKTTFLRNLKETCPKRMVVVAPTGVAAINAGGVTIHSFFQMPFSPYMPGQVANTQRKFSKEKVKIIRNLDLLVIDEISMVRADLLDGIDAVLRQYRRNSLPFGGVQLLMIGDLHQLSPVVKDDEWEILRQYYASVYFFSSTVLQKTELVPIELKHIYRQADSHFVDLLNRVRNNQLDLNTLNELNTRYVPNFDPPEEEGYIRLSTHNASVDGINHSKLQTLQAAKKTFRASIEGNFPAYAYPTSEELVLKKGAQVMFVRNDSSPEKRYFNGKIGTIARFSDQVIYVKCKGEAALIEVEIATWENIKYTVNETTKEIEEEIIGKFDQYPLKLAWAITIHKSQGLTFDRAIIDANAAFAHGQVYVALSRCRTFEGMVLSSKISSHAVRTDHTVSSFVNQASNNLPSHEKLRNEKIKYQRELLIACFDFKQLQYLMRRFSTFFIENKQVITWAGASKLVEDEKKVLDEVFLVGEKFQRQLQKYFSLNTLPDEDEHIQERVKKGASYFKEKLEGHLYKLLRNMSFETDNKELRKQGKKLKEEVQNELSVKLSAISSCVQSGFNANEYMRAVSLGQLDFKPEPKEQKQAVEYTTEDIAHPALFNLLRQWRAEKATEEDIEQYRVLHLRTLIQITVCLPDNLKALLKVKGIGKANSQKYGEEIISMVKAYCEENKLEANQLPKPKNAEKGPEIDFASKTHPSEATANKSSKNKIPTKQQTLELLKAGYSLHEIAEQRELAISTVATHLQGPLHAGEIDIYTVLEAEKVEQIRTELEKSEDKFLKPIKEALGDAVEYYELNMVRASMGISIPKLPKETDA